jgi:plastocyanin
MYGVPLRMSGSSVEINPASMLPAPSRAEHGDPFKLCPPRATWSEPGFMDVGGSGNSLFDQTFFHAPGADATTGTFVSTVRGSNCSFPIPTFLQLTEPLGSMPANDYEDWLYYVADPVGVWTDLESSTFGEGEPLPRSVAFTGYRSHLFELWADPAKIDTEVWIVRNDPNGGRLVQRWPRVEQFPACSPPEGPAAGLSSASEGPTSAEQPPIVSSSIRAANLSFDTDTLALQADTRTTLTLENTDRGVPHSIMIRATDGVELFSGGLITGPSSIDYDIPPLAGGTYVFQCAVHPTMKGTVVVTTG